MILIKSISCPDIIVRNKIITLKTTLCFFFPQLNGLERSFYSFYVCTAVRKFFFFLDPLRSGKIRIQDILACSFLDDLLEVGLDLQNLCLYVLNSSFSFKSPFVLSHIRASLSVCIHLPQTEVNQVFSYLKFYLLIILHIFMCLCKVQ